MSANDPKRTSAAPDPFQRNSAVCYDAVLSLGATMRRREFIKVVGLAVTWPLVSHAQQPMMTVIGFLGPGSAESDAYRVIAFRQGLKESGYVEGQNLRIEYRWAEGPLRSPAGHGDRPSSS